MDTYFRDEVFVAGGQPTITYVERDELDIERGLARAIAAPNQIVSLAGPSKSGKTVLCKRVLGKREFVWIDGGQVSTKEEFWKRVCSELKLADVVEDTNQRETGGKLGTNFFITASGSHIYKNSTTFSKKMGMADAIKEMISRKIILVIDDFHYIKEESRVEIVRNIKGAVFNGLKVILLSVTHRTFDAVKAESELTGRFISIQLPPWTIGDLIKIATLGFNVLKVNYDIDFIHKIASESQENPFLMQRFCWEICFDINVDEVDPMTISTTLNSTYNLEALFIRIAKDAGVPIYQQLVTGPQSRKVREKRPLRVGGNADIYEATLMAIAKTGPRSVIKYDDLRVSITDVLADRIPQKQEITSALKHLSRISREKGLESAIDWDDENRTVTIADPYLRFYLRWQIRNEKLQINNCIG